MFEMSFYFASWATSGVVVIAASIYLAFTLFSLAEYYSKEGVAIVFLTLVVIFVAFFSMEYSAQLISTTKQLVQ